MILSPNPLRKLVLDFLVLYWSAKAHNFVAKSPALNAVWGLLFKRHLDLQKEFIFGLQRVVKMTNAQRYYAVAMPGPVPTEIAMGKEEGKGEVMFGGVKVKKEVVDLSGMEMGEMEKVDSNKENGKH